MFTSENPETLEPVLDSIGTALFLIDKKEQTFVFFLFNKLMQEQTGLSNKEIQGKSPADIFEADHAESLNTHIQQCYSDKSATEFQIVVGENGERQLKRILLTPIFSEDGSVSRILGNQATVLDHKNSQVMKNQLEQQLVQAQKMEVVGTLASGLAHDFNNMLTPILGNAEMIRQGLPDNSYLQEDLEDLIKAAQKAQDLVQQLLSFSRQVDININTVPITDAVKDAIKLIRKGLPRNIEVRSEIEEKCSVLEVNSTEIYQVIMNICINSYHAMKGFGGRIDITLDIFHAQGEHKLEYDQDYVHLQVKDNGHGIDPAVKEKMFDPFFTTKRDGQGTGLGLPVIKNIISNMGGRIIVESEKGKGTLFSVYLPLTGKKKVVKHKHDTTEILKMHILFVDDDQI
ncbi:MAG: PAS domain-containing protein, partial [Lentisphaeria bacterium]|nr:PAS domain-containing protein [Lentisphaeria bacterium]